MVNKSRKKNVNQWCTSGEQLENKLRSDEQVVKKLPRSGGRVVNKRWRGAEEVTNRWWASAEQVK
jgi:hypothetical protein